MTAAGKRLIQGSLCDRGVSRSVDDVINAVAIRQHGCVTTAQLVEAGLSPGAIKGRVRRGRLRRVHRGAYLIGVVPPTDVQRCMVAALAAGPGAAVSHLSAAIMREWWKRERLSAVDVTVGRQRRRNDVRVHYSRHWEPGRDIQHVNGVPYTTAPRTVIALGGKLNRYQLTNIVKEAAFHGAFDLRRFEREAERLHPASGIALARRAVASYVGGCAGTRSALEDRVIRLIEFARLKLPDEAGAPIGPHEVDLVWHRERLIVESDGPGHLQPNSRKKDPRRDADLRAAGFEVVRFTNLAIDGEPWRVVERLEEALERLR